MYTLGIPKTQYRRCTRVLGHESSDPIEYEVQKQKDGFYMFTFPGADEFNFRDIVYLLKSNGITTIGADDQLTEKKIMKIENLLNEQGSPEENDIIDSLKNILEKWDAPEYMGGRMEKCERSNQYHEDIRELVEDFEENFLMDLEDTEDTDNVEPYAQINENISLTNIYLNEDINEIYFQTERDAQWLLRGELPAGEERGTITKSSHSSLSSYKNLVKHLADNNQEETINFPKYGKINFKLLDNEDIEWSISSSKTYGDLSPEELEAEREKIGMKRDDEGNLYLDREYDPGNEPLEIQHSETGLTYFIDVEDIEAYVSGEEVIAVDPDRGEDAIRVTRDETDVVGVSEDELKDFMVSGDRSADDINEQGCTEQEIAEGTCGYGMDGKIGDKPAGPYLMRERFQKLANIDKKNG